ncbi:peptidase domain-containing ABC transporter [Novispirillum sp. DQ9]|uniref:peptidase domain-containing ABC transporter n=1 Tax=Novispirillum sp. DQ9 TaxID=3398612 RepID=UPI003C7B3D87
MHTDDTAANAKPAGLAWLRPVLRPLRPLFKQVLAISLFVNVMALASPIFVLQVYDRVVFHAGLSTLEGLVIGMILVLAFDYVLRQTRSRAMQSVSLRIDVLVGRALFDKVMALPLRTLEGRPTSYWQALFRDLDTVRNTLAGSTAILVADLPFAVLFLALVFVIAQPIAWVLLIALVLFMGLAWLSGRTVAAAAEREKSTQQGRDALMAETIMARTTIKALALEDHLRPLWEAQQAATIGRSIERGTQADRFVNLGQMLTVATSVAMTGIGAISIINQDMTMGGLVAANMLSGRLLGPLNQLVGAWRTFAGFRQSVDRLDDLFALREDRTESKIALARPSGRLRAEEVTFRYRPDGQPVIDRLSLDIAPGGVTAVMGANGSGKSTLLKLLLGLYPPSEGRVLLDGADVAQFTRRELARWMGYVPQECVLFDGTIRDNIAQGMPGATDADILRAAEQAGVHAFVVDLPDGYATKVGEAGALMSGGMRQRIAIARALVGDPPVLLMDEPSGSLDRVAEQQLRDALVTLAKERTVVVVSHSPVLLQGCRTILVLDRGRIAVGGPAADVLRHLSQQAARPRPAPTTPAREDA